MPEYQLIEMPDALEHSLAGQNRVGVDTEFMREKTFFAELCLIQVATPDAIYCVDPLTGENMASFWSCLTDRTWVVHSARQDIEVIYQSSQQMPRRIFDTQIAAGLLGFAPQLGYATLVQELFGVEIAKTHTRADWSKRPLTDALLHYAAEDVEYLLPAYETLARLLDEKSRRDWALEDSAQLLDPALYEINPHSAVERLKGARNLRGRRRAAASRLAAWRESEALRANRPRQWIVRDPVLIELATALPVSRDELQYINGLPPGLIRRSGDALLDSIAASSKDNNDYRPPSAPTEAQKAVMKSMQQRVADCAADLGLAAEIVASKKDLASIITGSNPHSRILSGWRRALVGEELLQLI